jgi:hypothetical protein
MPDPDPESTSQKSTGSRIRIRNTDADYNFWHVVEKLPAGCHSTKGVGRTEPDPAIVKEIDGAKVYLHSTFSCYKHRYLRKADPDPSV